MARPRSEHSLRAQVQVERAKWAWDEVQGVAVDDEEYRTEALKLPARLLTSGLGQTMAYLHAKAKGREGLKPEEKVEGVTRLHTQIAQRIRATRNEPTRAAMDIIVNLSAPEYRILGREVLEASQWIKRFAEGRIIKKTKKPQGGSA